MASRFVRNGLAMGGKNPCIRLRPPWKLSPEWCGGKEGGAGVSGSRKGKIKKSSPRCKMQIEKGAFGTPKGSSSPFWMHNSKASRPPAAPYSMTHTHTHTRARVKTTRRHRPVGWWVPGFDSAPTEKWSRRPCGLWVSSGSAVVQHDGGCETQEKEKKKTKNCVPLLDSVRGFLWDRDRKRVRERDREGPYAGQATLDMICWWRTLVCRTVVQKVGEGGRESLKLCACPFGQGYTVSLHTHQAEQCTMWFVGAKKGG